MLPALLLAAEPDAPAALLALPLTADDDLCPCGSGLTFPSCCADAGVAHPRLTRAALGRWARARGVAEQLSLLLREVTRTAPGSSAGIPRVAVACLSVAEFLVPPPEHRDLLASPRRLRLACWDFLRAQAELVREAVRREPLLLPRPEHPGLALLQDRLLELRAEVRQHAAPRPVEALAHCTLQLDGGTRALVFEERRLLSGLRGRVHPAFRLELGRAARAPLPAPACPCGSDVGCTHVLAAVDLALSRLADPYRSGEWDGLARELATPEWSRALAGLRALPAPRLQPASSPVRTGGSVAFVIVQDPAGRTTVTPWLRPAQGPSAARRAGQRELWDLARSAAPEDRRVLTALGFLRRARAGAAYPPSVVLRRPEDLLALAGHPRVHLDDLGSPPVTVTPAELGLLVRPGRDGGVEVVPVVDEEPVPLEALRPVREPDGNGAFLRLDRARALCQVVTAGDHDALSIVLASLERVDGQFPPEAEEALLEQLEVLRAMIPVTIAAELAAVEVPARGDHVLRLQLRRHGVQVELLVAPLVGAAAHPPGAGPVRLLATLDGRRTTTCRDLEAERVAADALAASLGLAPRPDGEHTWHVSDDAEAFALMTRLRTAGSPGLRVVWLGKPARCAGGRSGRGLRVEVLDRNDWFGVDGSVEIDGVQVGLAALLRALRDGRTVVRAGDDGWLRLEGALAERLRRLAAAVSPAPDGGFEAGPGIVGVLDDLLMDGATLGAGGAFTELRDRWRAAAALDPPLPPGFRAELRAYQREGFRWLARLAAWAPGGVLADDMGLGKTLQALALLCHRAGEGPALVLAPTSVCSGWVAEARRFAPGLRLSLYRDADREAAVRALGPGDVLVASYGLLTTHAACFEGTRFATLVLDEAQAVKNAATRRAQLVRGLCAGFTLALSGTPIENHLGELWSLFRIVFPRLLGSWHAFRSRFAAPIELDRDEGARLALAAAIRPLLLRRTKAEVVPELPPRTELVLPVDLSPGELLIYEEARLAAVAQLAECAARLPRSQRRMHLLAAITELRLLACHPRLRDPESRVPSSKLARFLELLPELVGGGHRTLVFSQFTGLLALVREALDAAGRRHLYLDGQTPPAERDALVRRFQAGEAELFLVSLRAGGSGLNLTAADYVVHLDPWWNPAVEDQASDRAHRIGQTRPVTVYRVVARGTIEDEILALQERKRTLVDGVLDGMGAAASLSVDELEALLTRAPPRGSPRGA